MTKAIQVFIGFRRDLQEGVMLGGRKIQALALRFVRLDGFAYTPQRAIVGRLAGGILAGLVASLSLLSQTSGGAQAAALPEADPCPRSAVLDTGPTDSAFYSTVSPFEHYHSDRNQLFPFTCSLRELGGPKIEARSSPVNFSTPYIPFTRDRDQLFVYGYGRDAATEAGFLARVDTSTLDERWRTRILANEIPNQWSYPGVALAHGNGFIYAIYANVEHSFTDDGAGGWQRLYLRDLRQRARQGSIRALERRLPDASCPRIPLRQAPAITA
jgi:hypothetical protein